MADTSPSLIGQTISHYRIVEKLGGGGMGVVYKAEDIKLRPVCGAEIPASKIWRMTRWRSNVSSAKRAASALNHPNICTIYEIDEFEGQHFIAMEFLEGATLKHQIGGRRLAIETLLDAGSANCRCPGRGALRTESSIATSSLPISSSPRAATRRFWISAWPKLAPTAKKWGRARRCPAGLRVPDD